MTNKERFKEIFISQVTRPGAADLLAWLGTTDFFEAPASTRFHGAYPGGLVEHSLNVYYALLGQSTIREYGGESVAVVALLHDVCKTGYYRRERDGKYSVKDRLPMGHGEKSVYLVMKFMDLTDEEALAIRWHMGAYDDAFRGGSRALNEAQDKCALVLALHHAEWQFLFTKQSAAVFAALLLCTKSGALSKGKCILTLFTNSIPSRFSTTVSSASSTSSSIMQATQEEKRREGIL